MAMAMVEAGDDAQLPEPQLVALGMPPVTASEVIELVRAQLVDAPPTS